MDVLLFTNERLQLPPNDTSIIWGREEEEKKVVASDSLHICIKKHHATSVANDDQLFS